MDAPIIESYSRSHEFLRSLETVWYVTPDGHYGDWRNANDRRLTVAEAADLPDFPTPSRQVFIDELQKGFDQNPEPTILVFPAYEVASGRLILLDGNHRAVAASRSEQEARLMIYAVRGPVDPFVLPDLLHEVADNDPGAWSAACSEVEQYWQHRSQ